MRIARAVTDPLASARIFTENFGDANVGLVSHFAH